MFLTDSYDKPQSAPTQKLLDGVDVWNAKPPQISGMDIKGLVTYGGLALGVILVLSMFRR